MPVQTIIKHRGSTAAVWASTNPVLAAREMGLETDTNKIKFGDGTTAWNALQYASGGATVEVSETAPVDAEPNTLWWDSANAVLYINYGGVWVETVGGVAGPEGPAGPTGATGATGPAGADGADGASAYEVAVANGFVGTEQQWLDSLSAAAAASAVSTIVDGAPTALDTLNELAAAIGDDANYAATITTALGNKQDKVAGVTNTEIGYLGGSTPVTSNIQSQLDAAVSLPYSVTNSSTLTYALSQCDLYPLSSPGQVQLKIWSPPGIPTNVNVGDTIYLTGTTANSLNIDNINFVVDSADDYGMYVSVALHTSNSSDNTAVDNYTNFMPSGLTTVVINKSTSTTATVTEAQFLYLDGVTSNIQAQLDTKVSKTEVLDIYDSYSIGASDGGILIRSMASAGITITVTDQFLAGEQIDVVQYGTGQITFAAGPGITLVSSGNKLKTTGQYSAATLKWVSDSAEVILIGDIAA